MVSGVNAAFWQAFKKLMPKLTSDLHKGQSGRIGIIGGSKEYTGAPYFSSISSMRVGADLAYVLTTKEAAPVIKSYSPELIVLPVLDSESFELDLRTWLSKFHTLVIGPGLGRSDLAGRVARTAFSCAKSQNIPIVIDADGLFVLSHELSLISGYPKCILTPNFMEFKRLYELAFNTEYDEKQAFSSKESQIEAARKLANHLGNVTIVKKGSVDIITDGQAVVSCNHEGSFKRCGGIGDLLTGTIATFSYWCHAGNNIDATMNTMSISNPSSESESNEEIINPNMLAAYNASFLIRESSKRAFLKFHRSILAVDIIEQIPGALYDLYDRV